MDNKETILKAEELLKVNKQENVLNFFKKLSNKFIIFDFLYSKISAFVLINFNFYIYNNKIHY